MSEDSMTANHVEHEIATFPGSPGRVAGSAGREAVFYDPRALAQRNPAVWPPVTRSRIGRPRDNEVLEAGEVLKDILPVISPYIDPVHKVGSGIGLVVSQRNGSWPVCGCVDCARDNLELRIQRRRGRERHAKCPLNGLPDRPNANGEVLEEL